jgi:sRNA-binding regulator protein Hfq
MATTNGLVLRGMVASYREFTSRKNGKTYRIVTVYGDLMAGETVLCQVDGYDVFVDSPDYSRGEIVELPARMQFLRDGSGRPVIKLYVNEGVW